MPIDHEAWNDVLSQYRPPSAHRATAKRLTTAGLTPDVLAEALASPLDCLDAVPVDDAGEAIRQACLAGEVAEYFATCSDAAGAARAQHVAKLVELTCVNDAAKALSLSQGYVSRLYRRPQDPLRPVMASLRRLLLPNTTPAADGQKRPAQ